MREWVQWLESEITRRKERNLFRELRSPRGIDFSSNDYLGLNSSGYLVQALAATVDEDPLVGSTGSRLIRGHRAIFEETESEFARFVGQESALLFTSGYAANLGTMEALFSRRDHVFCDRLAHASLLDGIRLSGARRHYFAHNDLNDLARQMKKYPARGRNWIVTESIFSMDGDAPNLPEFVKLAHDNDGLIYLDEAHAIGVFGKTGAGLAEQEAVANRIAVHVFPCGKAPGLMGAFVCGPAPLKDFLINRARSFVFSTAQPLVVVRLLNQIFRYFQSDHARDARMQLRRNADQLRSSLIENGLEVGESVSQIVPVIFGTEERALRVASTCQENNFDVRAIRPPTVPEGTSRLRICVQSVHTEHQIAALVETIVRATGR